MFQKLSCAGAFNGNYIYHEDFLDIFTISTADICKPQTPQEFWWWSGKEKVNCPFSTSLWSVFFWCPCSGFGPCIDLKKLREVRSDSAGQRPSRLTAGICREDPNPLRGSCLRRRGRDEGAANCLYLAAHGTFAIPDQTAHDGQSAGHLWGVIERPGRGTSRLWGAVRGAGLEPGYMESSWAGSGWIICRQLIYPIQIKGLHTLAVFITCYNCVKGVYK